MIVIFIGSEQGRKPKIYFPFLNPNYPIILLSLTESMFGLRRIFVFHLHWLSSQVSVKRCQNQAILSTFRFLGVKMLNLFLINFLAKSDNSKYFSFFIFFKNKIKLWSLCLPGIFKNSGHYVCVPSSKLIRDMLALSSDQYE